MTGIEVVELRWWGCGGGVRWRGGVMVLKHEPEVGPTRTQGRSVIYIRMMLSSFTRKYIYKIKNGV